MVVHIIDKLIGGGAESQLRKLVNNSRQFPHTIIYIKPGGEDLIDQKVKLICLGVGTKKQLITQLVARLKKLDFSILQTWLPDYFCIPAIVYTRLFKRNVKIISGDRRAPLSKLGYLYFRDRLKLVQHLLADIIVANFSFKKFGLVSSLLLSIKQQKVIDNAIEVIEKNHKLNTFENITELIFVGRLIEHKQPGLIIDLLSKLPDERHLRFNASIYGEGEMLEELKLTSVNQGLSERVQFEGFVKDWTAGLAPNSILVFPSLNEGTPNVLFEAASNGIPFIANDLEEINCHFESPNECYLIKKNSYQKVIEDYLCAISQLTKNVTKTHQMTLSAKQKASNYTIPSYIENWENLYKDLSRVEA